MSKNGASPPEDLILEQYVLSDKQYLEALALGASQLGIFPTAKLARLRQAKADIVANGAMLQLWLKPEQAIAPPPPDPEMIRGALQSLGLSVVPTIRQISRWTRSSLEEVATWAATVNEGDLDDMPPVLADLQNKRSGKRRPSELPEPN
jgi:hypothetical protein